MMTRTLYPDTRLGVRIWHRTIEGDAAYRILHTGAQWRLQERSVYGGRWQTIEEDDVNVLNWLGLHHCELAAR